MLPQMEEDRLTLTASIGVAAVAINCVVLLAGVGPSALPLRSELAEIQSAQ